MENVDNHCVTESKISDTGDKNYEPDSDEETDSSGKFIFI